MQVVIKVGGSQYRVSPDQVFYVELLPKKKSGDTVKLSEVLFYQKDKEIKIGRPYIPNARVEVSVLDEVKGPKLRAYKYKRRKNYQKNWGHRQKYHKLQVKSISV